MDFPRGFKEKYEAILGQQAADFFASFDQPPVSAFRTNPLKESQQSYDQPIPHTDWGHYGKVAGRSIEHVTGCVYSQEPAAQIYLEDGSLYFRGELVMQADEIGVPGSHNVENALATIAVAKLRGIDNQTIRETLSAFGGVKHRLQYVGELDGVKFYNDSKSTNILATQKALSGFENGRVILIAGGLDRGNEFDELVADIKGLKKMVILGESAARVKRAADKAGVAYLDAEDVRDAVRRAFEQAGAGDVILLSPANASWDMYKNFEVRGEEFIAAFEELKG